MEKEKATEKKTSRSQPPRSINRTHHGCNMMFWRLYRKLSQEQLAKTLNCTQQYVSQLEKSEIIEEKMIEEIAKALKVEPQDITDWKMDPGVNIFDIDKLGEGDGSTNMVGTYNFETHHEVHIYPLDKVCELYDRIISDKEKEIQNRDLLINKWNEAFNSNLLMQKELLEEFKRLKS